MVTPRLLLFYNFGIALLFAALGVLSLLALEPTFNRQAIVPPFDVASLNAIRSEQDMEQLRSRAAFYFELGRDLKRARYADAGSLFADLRKVSFAIALAFGVGGILSAAVTRKRPA